ncbi:glucosaminidase domain-containing protein [Limibacter armeniacum]|uniref:glucosaminidase domain-containing protein n=1 Tax=Limibacter armeniacum TaxID=466084 RepID=UPI002FE59A8C
MKWKAFLYLILPFFCSVTYAQKGVGLYVQHPERAVKGETVYFNIYAGDKVSSVKVLAKDGSLGVLKVEAVPAAFSFQFNYEGVKELTFISLDKNGIALSELESGLTVLPQVTSVSFPPTPVEDEEKGRNDNAYLAATTKVSKSEKETFVQSLKPIAQTLGKEYNVPPSALLGIAALESGYGTTRTAYFANNLMGIKKWGIQPTNAYQLKGQPDEDEGNVKVLRHTVSGQLIFDEENRKDNWYQKFESKEACLRFFVEIILLNQDGSRWREYRQVVTKYQTNWRNELDKRSASRKFVFELGEKGYNHLGGNTYLNRVGRVMDELNLYRFD